MNGASWGAGRSGGSALALDGTGGHLALPGGVMQDLGDFTIALWVYWPSAQSGNSRVFDFGSSDIAYFGLMPGNGSSPMRCMFTGTTWYGEQNIVAAGALPTGRWVHLAVTLSGTTGTLYVDGAVSGSNTAVHARALPARRHDAELAGPRTVRVRPLLQRPHAGPAPLQRRTHGRAGRRAGSVSAPVRAST